MAQVIANQPFLHGAIKAKCGDVLSINDRLANELIRAGLVRLALETPAAKKPTVVNGPVAPSFVLPPAPVSQTETAQESPSGKRRPGRPRKVVESSSPATTPTE